MSVDLAGGALASFLLGELRPVISRHPRFRDCDGSSLSGFSNLILYKDVSMTVGGISSAGDKQSPDLFMCTVLGRSTVAKLNGQNGTFVEWVQETDKTRQTPEAGLYYLSISSVNNGTRDVQAVLQICRWLEGRRSPGGGSRVYLSPRIPADIVAPQDPTVSFRVGVNQLVILSYTPDLTLIRTDTGATLVPNVDWWVQPWQRFKIVDSTTGGPQTEITIPPGYVDLRVVDQDGYVLRENNDWLWSPMTPNQIQLSPWTPPGSTLYADGHWRCDPSLVSYVDQENVIPATLTQGETLVPGQSTAYSLMRGDFPATDIVWNEDGTATLTNLMDVSDRLRWELHTQGPQVVIDFKKMAVNHQLFPGLDVAVGDQVEVGDQLAIVVFPTTCEIYEVYGAKDSMSFEITIKSNDLLTSTELSNLVKNYMLIEGRNRLEDCGLTVMRIATSYQGGARDASGTTASHSVVLSVTAAADWEYHKPLVNRLMTIDLSGVAAYSDFPGKPTVLPKVGAFGLSQFLPSYQ